MGRCSGATRIICLEPIRLVAMSSHRLIYGARNTIGIALITTLLSFLIGGTLGLVAAIEPVMAGSASEPGR